MGVRLLNGNYIDTDIVSNSFVSSAQAAFPVANVYNKQRRSKVWRSNGYWEITAGSNTIIFRETVGVDLTATISPGIYTSTVTLLSALKTAFEATGDSTYTWSIDTATGKFKVVSNGVGGGGILHLKWTNGASAAMAGILGFDTATDQTFGLTYLADVLRIHYPNEWIKWDLGLSSNPTAFVLIGPRNRAIKISPSATIKLEGNETNAWTAPSYSQTLTYDDSVISLFAASGLHTEPLRYWRLSIVDVSNSFGYVEIGALYLGEYFESVRGQVEFPFTTQPIDRSETVFSEGGQTFSDLREQSERFDLKWNLLTIAEKESIQATFEDFGTATPFFISLDPSQVHSSSATKMIRYVKFESEPQFTLFRPGAFECTMTLREEL